MLTHEHAGSRLTSGVSTTPHYNRADFYARTDNGDSCHGYIYKIDRDACARLGIREYRVRGFDPKPSVLEDDEIILVSVDGGPLPAEITVEIVEVPNEK